MINVAVVGTGNISLSHLNAYLAFPERCRVVALCDVTPDRAEARRREIGLDDAVVYSSYEDLIARGDIDLVSICTPPDTHEELSIAFLRAGVNVLCEKPMAPSLAACDAILAAEAESGAMFSAVAQNRYRDDIATMRAALESGLMGPITSIQIDSAWWRGLPYYDLWWRGTWEQEGGGCTLNHAVHHIDLMLHLFGAPESVSAVITNAAHENAEIEDLSVAVFSYDRAVATLVSSVVHHGQDQRFVVQGRDARVSLPYEAVAEISQPNGFPVPGGNTDLVARLDALAAAQVPLAHTAHEGQIDDVLSAIETGRAPAIGGEGGRRTIEMITAIYKAGIERRTVDLPLSPDDPLYQRSALPALAPHFFEKTASVDELVGAISVSGASSREA